MPKPREVEREIAKVLVTPLWEDIRWISAIDLLAARDRDVTTDVLDEQLACVEVKRADWDRLAFLREELTPAHRAQLEDALEATQRAGLVELLSYTCETSKQFAAALKRAGAGPELQPAIDYALRRFVDEAPVAKKLWSRARSFATTAARGKWQLAGEQAWRALYVTDTRESADAMTAMIAATWIYTNHGVKERLSAAAAKRARMLSYRQRCIAPLLEAMPASYSNEEITHSAVAIRGAAVRRVLEEKWREYTTYQMDNDPARTALGGLLVLAPTSKTYRVAVTEVLPTLLKEKQNVGWDDVGLVNGLVIGIAAGRGAALRPLLEKVVRWKITGSPYDNHGPERALLAAELVRRRARRALDER